MTGNKLRELRKSLGMTQTQLAEAIGRTQERISHYETGRWPIPRVVELAVSTIKPRETAHVAPGSTISQKPSTNTA